MSWVLFSILAAVIWAMVNIVDKYVLTKWIKEPAIPVMFLGIIGLILSAIIFSIKGIQFLSGFNLLLVFVAGTCYILMNVFYFNALKREEVSRAVPLYYLTPLFVLLLATIFLNEVFQPLTYLGIFLLVVGAIMISIKRTPKITISKALGFMLLAAFSWAVYAVIIKYLLNFADFWTVFAYARVGTIIALAPLIYLYFPKFLSTIRKHGKKVAVVISANELLNITGVFFVVIASSIGYVSLVETLTSTHVFFVLLFALILSIFFPKILKEEIGRSTVMIKFIAVVLMFIGVILIT